MMKPLTHMERLTLELKQIPVWQVNRFARRARKSVIRRIARANKKGNV